MRNVFLFSLELFGTILFFCWSVLIILGIVVLVPKAIKSANQDRENESCEEEGQDEETNCMFDQPIRFGEVWASDFDKNAFILLGVFPGRDWTDEQIKRAKDFLANTDNPFLYPLLTKELAYREEQKEQLRKLIEYASEFDCADTPSEEAKK